MNRQEDIFIFYRGNKIYNFRDKFWKNVRTCEVLNLFHEYLSTLKFNNFFLWNFFKIDVFF